MSPKVNAYSKRLAAMRSHVPYGITLCCLSPGRGDIPVFTPVNQSWSCTRFIGKDERLSWPRWLICSERFTNNSGHLVQVERRTAEVRRPVTDVLPLCYATNHIHTQKSRSGCQSVQRQDGNEQTNKRTRPTADTVHCIPL